MWRLTARFKERLRPSLEFLYGPDRVDQLLERVSLMSGRYSFLEKKCSLDNPCWDQSNVLLITYGDMIRREGEKPLRTLGRFLDDFLAPVVRGVHVLPFFPWSSDDGFSVMDYRRVDPDLGGWPEIEAIGERYRLMVDLVLNHCSSRSRWFQDYIGAVAPYRDYFIEVDPAVDLSAVVRPRTTPLLTPVQTVHGKRWLWTTFSADQVDLNWANPDVLLEMLDVLLGYISHGARVIRLDAIAYLWKEIGTSCLNLPQTHEVVRLIRTVLDSVTPGTVLLTETNLPHEQNVSYFGNGDQAHLIYQFSLPPLLLHTLQSGSSRHLQEWAAQLAPPPPGCGFLNFTASHDGIGVRPLEGLLDGREIERVIQGVRDCGGFVSSRTGDDGGEKPYELNITWFDAMKDPDRPEDSSWQMIRFLCSQIIMLSLRGIPAIYFHSLVGVRNDHQGVAETGQYRSINRGRWQDGELRGLLAGDTSLSGRVFRAYTDLLRIRKEQVAFHPDTPQRVIDCPDSLFVLVRTPDNAPPVTCVHNVSPASQEIGLDELGPACQGGRMRDLISGDLIEKRLHLEPYQCCWLRPAE